MTARPGLARKGMKNPKLVLEDGGWVFGCETWWGPGTAEDIQRWIGSRTVVKMDPIHTDEHPAGTSDSGSAVIIS